MQSKIIFVILELEPLSKNTRLERNRRLLPEEIKFLDWVEIGGNVSCNVQEQFIMIIHSLISLIKYISLFREIYSIIKQIYAGSN